jgi:hypothetical protein
MAATYDHLQVITNLIRSKKIGVCELLTKFRELKIGSNIPRGWVVFLEQKIDALYKSEFWHGLSAAPEFRTLKYSRRFFPPSNGSSEETKEEYKTITKEVKKKQYPDMIVGDKPANYVKANITEISNYGSMLVREPGAPDNLDRAELAAMIDIFTEAELPDLLAKLAYYLSINYDTCHLIYTDSITIDLVTKLLNGTYRDIILAGLRYANMLLAHEEEVIRDHFEAMPTSQRFLLTLDQIHRVTWLPLVAGLSLDIHPLITICGFGSSIYNRVVFHLDGKRSLPTTIEFARRINEITNNAFTGINEKWNYTIVEGKRVRRNYVSLCGSAMTLAGGDNVLGDYKKRGSLYYGDSDYDIVIAEPLYKEFFRIVPLIAADIAHNLNETETDEWKLAHIVSDSGIRFIFTHVRLSRHIEIFRTPRDPIKLVSMFHMPSVKALWTFEDLIMCRSYIVAMLTGVCETFDWFSTNKIPMDITLKNAQRGYGTYHNDKEIETLEKYFQLPREHAWSYRMLAKRSLMTGQFSYKHQFFRIDQLPLGIRSGQPLIPGSEVVEMASSSRPEALSLTHNEKPISFWKEKSGAQWHINPPPVW